MNILITNTNIDFFKEIHPKAKIEPSTVNTSVIKCSEKTFIKIRNEVRAKGINPYSIMYWY